MGWFNGASTLKGSRLPQVPILLGGPGSGQLESLYSSSENASGQGMAQVGISVGQSNASNYDVLFEIYQTRILPSPYSGLHSVAITTATTTAVKASGGAIGTIINAGTATSGTVTIYDNTAASGKLIWAGTLTAGQVLPLGIPCGTGITVVTAAADTITVSYA